SRVLEVKVVDARPPVAQRAQRITAAEQQVPGVEAKADRRQVENLLDLPGGLDPAAGLMVERRLITPFAAQQDSHLDAFGETFPGGLVETQRPVGGGLAGPRPAQIAPDVGQGRLRLEAVLRFRGGKDVEKRTKLAECSRHPVCLAEGQLEEST